MAIREELHVLQGDDNPKHVTVRDHKTGLPKDLTGWKAIIQVVTQSEDGTALFSYNTDDNPGNIHIDDQVAVPGGISLVFTGTQVPDPLEAWYRLRVVHTTLAPNGRTVRYGPFVVDDT